MTVTGSHSIGNRACYVVSRLIITLGKHRDDGVLLLCCEPFLGIHAHNWMSGLANSPLVRHQVYVARWTLSHHAGSHGCSTAVPLPLLVTCFLFAANPTFRAVCSPVCPPRTARVTPNKVDQSGAKLLLVESMRFRILSVDLQGLLSKGGEKSPLSPSAFSDALRFCGEREALPQGVTMFADSLPGEHMCVHRLLQDIVRDLYAHCCCRC